MWIFKTKKRHHNTKQGLHRLKVERQRLLINYTKFTARRDVDHEKINPKTLALLVDQIVDNMRAILKIEEEELRGLE